MYFGNASQSAILPTLVRPPLATVTPSLELKRFLPFPLDTAAAVNLFPSFSTAMVGIPPSEQALPLGNWKSGLACRTTCMDPVQKAIINHTFGLPPQPKRKHVVVCTVCRLKFNSESQASAHYKGTKHGKKLKALEAPSGKQKVGEACGKDVSKSPSPVPVPTSTSTDKLDTTGALLLPKLSTSKGEGQAAGKDSPSESVLSPSLETSSMADADGEPETEEEKAKRLLYCSLCKVAVNSASQLEAHNSGSKHKTMLDARNGSGAIKSFPRPGQKSRQASPAVTATGLQNKTFQCEICDVHVNSETQLKQHISSRRHKDRAAGKPAKPKYSPYSKPQRGQVAPPVRLVLRKELNLGKTLQAGLLPGHLAAAAAAAATLPAFSLRSTPSLYQTPPLPTPLLRPAPGPVRTTHAPLLFTPY